MNGFIGKTVAVLGLAAGLSAATGCCGYNDVVDPCYPSRYSFQARRSVCEALYKQCRNGHVLDQTVWNWHFEENTDKLTPGGMEHLTYILRRRPCPDQTVYLATASVEEVKPAYTLENSAKFAQARIDLDAKRTDVVRKYLDAQTAGRGLNFQVVVHDPAPADLHANPMGLSTSRWMGNFQGVLPGGAAAGGGGAGAGGGGGR